MCVEVLFNKTLHVLEVSEELIVVAINRFSILLGLKITHVHI